MSTNQNLEKICCIVLVFCIVIATLMFNAEGLGIIAAEKTNSYINHFFDDSYVHSIDIIVDENSWDNMIANASDKEYINCTLNIDNVIFSNVAIRAKGNSSLQQVQSSNSDRYSLKIEFDHYDNTKTYFGLDKFTLNNIIQDNTFMKDYLAYTLMGEFGVASPLVSFTEVLVNGEPFGLYLGVEAIEEGFLQRNYGNNYGIAYKPETSSGMGNMPGMENIDPTMLMEMMSTVSQDEIFAVVSEVLGIPISELSFDTLPTIISSMDEDVLAELMPQIMQQLMGSQAGGQMQGQGQMPDMAQGQGQMGEMAQGQGQMGDMAQGQGQMGDMAQGQGQMGDMAQGQGQMGEMAQGQGQMGDMAQGQGQMGDMAQGQGQMGEMAQGQGQMGDMAQGQGQMGDMAQGQGQMPDMAQGQVREPMGDEPQVESEFSKDELIDQGFTRDEVQGQIQGQNQSQQGGNRGQQGGGMQGMGSSISSALEYTDDDVDSYTYIFDNAVLDISKTDKTRLISSLKQMNEQVNLEKVVDIEATLRYFVVHNFLLNYDSYTGAIMHNYYLYENNGVLSMLPWDYNLSFVAFMNSGHNTQEMINFPIDTPVSTGTIEARPMLSWIFSSDEYTEQYHEIFGEFIEQMYTSDYMVDLINDTATMLDKYVQADETKFCTYEDYQKGVEALLEVVTLRCQSIEGQLDGTIPSTAEGQAENPSSLVETGSLQITDTGSESSGGGGGGGGDRGQMQGGDRGQMGDMPAGDMATPGATAQQAGAGQMQNQQGNQQMGGGGMPGGDRGGATATATAATTTQTTPVLVASLIMLIIGLIVLSLYNKRKI